MENTTVKRAKTQKTELHIFPNFSPLLSQPFQYTNEKFLSYFYKILPSPLYGVLFPIEFSPLPSNLIAPIGQILLTHGKLSKLRDFQHEFWSELLKSSKDRSMEVSPANYLVVPLVNDDIDWNLIAIALNPPRVLQPLFIENIPANQLIVKTKSKSNLSWKILEQIDPYSDSEAFLTTLLGEESPKLKSLLEKYKGYSAADVIFDENFNIESVKEFRNCHFENPEHSDLIFFAKQARTARYTPETHQKKKKNYPRGTPLLSGGQLEISFLNPNQWDQGPSLLETLIKLESYTYIVEFCQKFTYKGGFFTLRDATSAPSLDLSNNYDSLECIGDTVLKVISSLYFYLKHLDLKEGPLTEKRTKKINNNFLSKIAKKNELGRYLKCEALTMGKFRPPFHEGKYIGIECSQVEHLISDGMLADFVEALIGCYYTDIGILESGLLLEKLDIFTKDAAWLMCLEFLSNEGLHVCSQLDKVENYQKSMKLSELVMRGSQIPEDMNIESIIGYTFKDSSLLDQAFTNKSAKLDYDYERLEFLGDAVLDMIAVSNLSIVDKFSAEELSMMKDMMVNNNVLAKISITLGLQNYLKCSEYYKKNIKEYIKNAHWDAEITDIGNYKDKPEKILSDIFEALIGAVLIDSGSLVVTCRIFGCILRDPIVFLANNREKCLMKLHLQDQATENEEKNSN